MTHPDTQPNDGNGAPDLAIRAALMIGMAISLLAMAAGLLLALATGAYASHHTSLRSLIQSAIKLNPGAVIELGVLALIATPVAGIVAAITHFLGKRNRDAATAFVVLAMLVVSFALAQR